MRDNDPARRAPFMTMRAVVCLGESKFTAKNA
jgi:hypothetical protein